MTIVAIAFLLALALAVPLGFTLCLAAVVFLLTAGRPPEVFTQQLYAAADSFPLLAIPFFLLAGDLLNRTGMTAKLIDFAMALFGWMRGGLAHVNIGASMLFAGISGSAIADSAAVGKLMIPAMTDQGFTARTAAAVTAASSIIGPIIPPSIVMIVYGSSLGVPVSGLFAAGVLPGILVGLVLMAMVFYLGARGEPMGDRTPLRAPVVVTSALKAAPSLAMPLIILGGMLSGVFTATEAGAVAVAYAIIVSMAFRLLTPRALIESITTTGTSTALVMFIIAASNPFGWLLSVEQIPQQAAAWIVGLSDSPVVVLLLINALLLVVGTIMETTASVLILGPILLPIAAELGVDPIHFAMIVIINLLLGLLTPPLGLCLFVVAPIAGETVERIARACLPFMLAQLAVLLTVTFVPDVSLWIPDQLGLH